MRHFWDCDLSKALASNYVGEYDFTYTDSSSDTVSNTSATITSNSYEWNPDYAWWYSSNAHDMYSRYERFVDAWNAANPNSWINYDPINMSLKISHEESQNTKIDPSELEELL